MPSRTLRQHSRVEWQDNKNAHKIIYTRKKVKNVNLCEKRQLFIGKASRLPTAIGLIISRGITHCVTVTLSRCNCSQISGIFRFRAEGNICLLSDSNIGLTGALKSDRQFDYYEMTERSVNCNGMYICNNRKCINQTQVCNGKNDCYDRSDESICTAENLDYDIRLAGTNNTHEGRIEVKGEHTCRRNVRNVNENKRTVYNIYI